MDLLIQKIIASLVRQGMGALATYLIAQGAWTQSQADTVTGAVIAVALFAWTWYKNHKEVEKVDTALAMPRGSTREELSSAIDAKRDPRR